MEGMEKEIIFNQKYIIMTEEKVKFGISQINNPTPKWATQIFRAVLYTAAAASIVLGIVTEIPDHLKEVILRYSVETVALVHALSKLLGVTIVTDPTIPTDGGKQ